MTTSAMVGGRTDFFISTPIFLDYYYTYSNINRTYSNLGNITEINNCESVQTRENYFSLAGGLPISHRSLFSLRANVGWNYYFYDTPDSYSTSTLDESLLYDRTRLSFTAAKAEYQRNTLNRLSYPSSGSKLEISAIGVLGKVANYNSDYSRSSTEAAADQRWLGGRIKYDKYFTPTGDSWFSLGVNLDAVYTTLGSFGNPTTSMLILPSYQPVAHSQMIYMPDFSAAKYIGAGIVPIFDLGSSMLLRTGFYAMCRPNYSVEGVNPGVIGSDNIYYVSELSLVYNSSLGALSLSGIKYDVSSWKNCYITFSFGVPIFSPKGTYY